MELPSQYIYNSGNCTKNGLCLVWLKEKCAKILSAMWSFHINTFSAKPLKILSNFPRFVILPFIKQMNMAAWIAFELSSLSK